MRFTDFMMPNNGLLLGLYDVRKGGDDIGLIVFLVEFILNSKRIVKEALFFSFLC